MMKVGAVILAGGKASRMGGCGKDGLELGGQTFLERLAAQLAEYRELLLSVDRPGRLLLAGATTVADEKPDCGPMGGLAAALRACGSPALLAVAVDMPLFQAGLGRYLQAFLHDGCDAVVAVDRQGRTHPLCGIYRDSCLPVFERRLAAGDYRLQGALADLRVRRAPLEHSAYPDAAVANINTPEEYAALRRSVEGPPVLAVSGTKSTGKTTLLRGVIPLLAAQGLRVGTVKHDGHDFVPDVPGTDSFYLREAGAERVAVFSPHRFMATGVWQDCGLEPLLPQFKDMDLILVEGMKHSTLAKIEIVGPGGSVCDPATLIATAGSADLGLPGVPFFRRDDYHGLAECIARYRTGGH